MTQLEQARTQLEQVRMHLRTIGSITPRDAFIEYGIMRLAALICILRKEGMRIVTIREVAKNRYGNATKYARYILREDNK